MVQSSASTWRRQSRGRVPTRRARVSCGATSRAAASAAGLKLDSKGGGRPSNGKGGGYERTPVRAGAAAAHDDDSAMDDGEIPF